MSSLFALLLSALVPLMTVAPQNPFLGAWAMTGTGDDASFVYWLEVKEEQGRLTGMFLNRVGNPVPLGVVKVENGELVFQGGTAERPTGPEYRAKIEQGQLVGRHALPVGGRGRRGAATDTPPTTPPTTPPPPPAPTERIVNWVGVRPPSWPAVNANGAHRYGTPVALFDGTSMEGWGVQIANRAIGWSVVDGAMTNGPRANNLVSKATFTDFKVELEYKLGENSNGGLYLRGRYELQLLDDLNATNTRPDLSHMAIYGRKAPDVKASKPAGEWQTMSAVLVGNRVTVTLNGQRVHDNAPIAGITGGALDNHESAPGPIMVQGDHSAVWIRKLVVTPILSAGR